MDERQVNAGRAALREHAALEDRRQTVQRALEKADAPPAALQAVRDASDLCALDDLHAPFKQVARHPGGSRASTRPRVAR
jgi:transcriptional accessory protein Tex/SPT6